MLNFELLIENARNGALAEKDLDEVVKIVETTTSGDIYSSLYILGLSGAIQYRHLVEKFLYYPSYPMMSKLALEILCGFWGLTSDYLVDLKKFLYPVEWDPRQDIRIVALNAAGEYLRQSQEREILQSLINIFENEQEDSLMRACAYEAVNRAIGLDWGEGSTDDTWDMETLELIPSKIDPAVLEAARGLLKKSTN